MKKDPLYYFSPYIMIFSGIAVFTLSHEVYKVGIFYLLTVFIVLITAAAIFLFVFKRSEIYLFLGVIFIIFILYNALNIRQMEKNYSEKTKMFSDYPECIGKIESYPLIKNNKEEIKVKVIAVRYNAVTDFIRVKPFYILLKIRNDEDNKKFENGDIIKISKELSVAQEKIFSFNYRRYLYFNKIYGIATADSEDVEIVEKIKPDPITFLLKKTIRKARADITDYLKESLSSRTFGFLVSIYLGERSELDKEIFREFTNTGLLHLIAISGLNISFLSLVFLKILKSFLSKTISLTVTLILIYIYIIIIIPSASSTRAFLMFLFPALYFLSGSKTAGFSILSASGLCMSSVNPYCIFDIGFQFSFYATAGIMLFSNSIKQKLPDRIPDKIKTDISMTVSAFASIIFIQWHVFKQVSFFSIISSVFMVPFFNIFFVVTFFLLIIFCLTKLSIFALTIEVFTSLFLRVINLLNLIPSQKLPEIPVYIGYLVLPLMFLFFYLTKKIWISLKKQNKKISVYKFVKGKI